MKKVLFGIFILCLLGIVVKIIIRNDFTNSIHVATKSEANDLNYYEINDKGVKRNVDVFVLDDAMVINVNDCYDSYIDNNKVLNKLTIDSCVLISDNEERIEISNELQVVIESISKLEHDMLDVRLFKIKEEYYVVVEFNVNIWSPYSLYYFDKDKEKLKEIYTFDGEDIVGIKIK